MSVLFSISLYWLSHLQIFIDSHALLTYDKGGFEHLKTENKTKIDPLAPELQASFEALPEPDLCALGDDERLRKLRLEDKQGTLL